ncbi:MAG: L-histidine N(alpha)-methyltransferase [Bacteroidota bacterium]
MAKNILSHALTSFGQEVQQGLSAFPKYLSSKYFYDAIGDKLFQDIMAMPEYYLTQAEFDILEAQAADIAAHFAPQKTVFSLFELGAGDGKKTKILLRHLVNHGYDFDYRPIDISQNALDNLQSNIAQELPGVSVNPLQGSYFETLKTIGATTERRKVILFLGSNIGNLLHRDAISFLQQLNQAMNDDDLLLMGMDQKKNPQTVLSAYNDPAGITEAFNKNVLTRINRELDGNFDLEKFKHWEVYDPETGTAKSYLVAKEAHKVYLGALDLEVRFEAWETIHTEISQKYDDQVVSWLTREAGFEIQEAFTDAKKSFKDYILKKQ